MKIMSIVYFVILSTFCFAQGRPIPTDGNTIPVPHDPTGSGTWSGRVSHTKFQTILGLKNPESVLITENGVYVSEMGADTGKETKDGKLSKYNLKGELDTKFSLKNSLISPMGMVYTNDTIYVADQTRVIGISTRTGREKDIFDFSFLGANFLNDIDIVEDRFLFVTATNLKRIFCIDLYSKSLVDIDFDLLGSSPNGITFDKDNSTLYIAANKTHTLGKKGNGVVLLYKLNLNSLSSKLIDKKFLGRFLDGIKIDGETVVLSDWYSRKADGRLYVLNKLSLRYLTETVMRTSGLADFDYDEASRLLVTPDLVNGKVYFYRKNNK